MLLRADSFSLLMPQLDGLNHTQLLDAGYAYDAKLDKYYNRGTPAWETAEKMEAGRRQGAFPSRNLEEFREQETAWISREWLRIKEMRSKTTANEDES